jgi:type I restriction enzyme S subunit
MSRMKPEVRFKGFEDDWSNSFMKDVASFSKGKGYSKDDLISKGDPIILYGQMYTNYRFVIDTVKTYAKHKPKSVISTGNEVIIPSSGETSEEISRAAAVSKPGVILGGDLNIIKPNNNISSSYLAMALSTNTAKNQMSNRAQGKSVVHLYNEDIKEVQVFFPSINEQKRISNLIKELDNSIELKNKELSKLKQFKQAMLQEIFPKEGDRYPRLRFTGFTDAWEQRKVKDIFKVTRGYVLAATKTTREKTTSAQYPVYSSQTLNQGLMGYYKDYLYEDAITWTTDGANAGTVNYRAGKFYCTNVCGVLISDEGYANKMVAEALNMIAWKHVSKVGNPKLMNNVMSEIIISIPKNMEEHKKISRYFSKLDNFITIHQRKLEKLKQFKQAMLKKMFV